MITRSRAVCEAGADGLHGSGATCRDRYKNGVKKGRDWEGHILGERQPAWGRWEGDTVSETCGWR
jgi:hypothetical protein